MPDADDANGPAEDLARIVMRADRLGFSVERVATALGLAPNELTSIRQRMGMSTDRHSLDDRAHHQPGSSTISRTQHG